jgi:hypothetical protein
MGCNCKNDNNSEKSINIDNLKENKTLSNVGKTTLKVIVYLFSIVIFFIIIPYIFWVLFKTIVLSKDFDFVKSVQNILPNNRKNTVSNGETDEEEYEDDDMEYYENEFGEHYDNLTDEGNTQPIDVEVIETVKN